MYYKNLIWSVESLITKIASIDPKPPYQRGEVWRIPKKQLLIDSIINRYDIPKLYLRHLGKNGRGIFIYEIADGQQRINAITEYVTQESFRLGVVKGRYSGLSGKSFKELPVKCQTHILQYDLSIAVAYNTSDDEVRELFARLQAGDRLTPAELRNSIASDLGTVIRAMAITHKFFPNSPFPLARYKADDLLAHAFAIEMYGGARNLKALDLREMYISNCSGEYSTEAKKINEILKFMDAMQLSEQRCIATKWGFVDIYTVLSRNKLHQLTASHVAVNYVAWESARRSNTKLPERLIENRTPSKKDKDLYSYIMAFRREGANKSNLYKRANILARYIVL